MRILFLSILFVSASMTSLSAHSRSLVEALAFAPVDTARKLMAQEDMFTRSWSPYDIDARLQKVGSTKAELFAHIDRQIRGWEQKEMNQIRQVAALLDSVADSLGLVLDMPEQVYLVKTTGEEESGAVAYTRGNYIVFKEEVVEKGISAALLAHELFHVLTRHNPDFRDQMYAIIGFQRMEAISYPPALAERRITNPDAPHTDAFIELTIEGDTIPCMMVLYAKEPYAGGSFFEALQMGFLQLTDGPDRQPLIREGEPVIHGLMEVQDFFSQVGNNTKYIIHPEEILADNFSFLLTEKKDLADPWVVERAKQILKE